METKPRYEYRAWVVVAHDGPYGDKGDVLSRHYTDAAANRAARKYGDWSRVDYTDPGRE